ncbi:preprotein translocase subunit SecA [Lactobacillus sp. ESL0680]|uniref:preprotein translocase subunit SecA n=1 Tax=Lactobacillus sp. ESL0680 TaxID=2983210 RepID=UPI0023F7EA52|nr:preprotein translocase subunit SecA [Lactobacillus sp. ESL0680]WEV39184.1 preprotein translocase subunit SecA [Lactobacillus sp. ESL0680]
MMHIRNHQYWRKTNQIITLKTEYEQLSDEALQAKTVEFRNRLKAGESLNSLLVEAYAVVCEADKRVLGLSPYKVQIFGAVAMQFHNVIEMKTGEGKTLTATMPMYLHGLAGNGNFLITANSYLAKRDALNMGRVYRWLGLSVGYNADLHEEENKDEDKDVDQIKYKKEVYANDIVYTDGGTFGFDYLTNNLVSSADQQYMPAFEFALIDEIDAVLLDLATTPLVISGRPKGKSNYPGLADKFIKICEKDIDYALSPDQKNVWFLASGIRKAEKFFKIENILTEEYSNLYCHLIFALQANKIHLRNRDYIVEDDKVILLDKNSGRKMVGMQMQAGIQQAIETKEGLENSPQEQVIATITYQNLFRLFPQLAGMTGTAKGDKQELMQVYRLNVVEVPTNKPSIRKDEPDKVFYTAKAKLMASLDLVKKNYNLGRPVLIETGSLTLSNLYSEMLLQAHIPHSLLNAWSVSQEATMIEIAGQAGMITVSTSLAGRGTDIVLSPEAKKAGGLLVIGTEKMPLKRIDDQLRGRSGRQGQAGTTVFYTSLQDQLVGRYPSKKIARKVTRHENDKQQEIPHSNRYRHFFSRLQKSVKYEEQSSRFMVLEYGEIARLQREAVYQARGQIIKMNQELDQVVIHSMQKAIKNFLNNEDLTLAEINDFVCDNMTSEFKNESELASASYNERERFLNKTALQALKAKKHTLANEDAWQYYLQLAIVKAIDDAWVDEVDNLEALRSVTAQRTTGQSNPLFEYQKEALASFNRMKEDIMRNIMRNVLCSEVNGSNIKGMRIYFA